MKKILRQAKRARKRKKEQKAKIIKQLQLSDFEYIDDDKNITLYQDTVLKEKLGIKSYHDPETFQDELKKYTQENIEKCSLSIGDYLIFYAHSLALSMLTFILIQRSSLCMEIRKKHK